MYQISDLDTHTTASGHAYNSLCENSVRAAAEAKCSAVPITPATAGSCEAFHFINFKVIRRQSLVKVPTAGPTLWISGTGYLGLSGAAAQHRQPTFAVHSRAAPGSRTHGPWKILTSTSSGIWNHSRFRLDARSPPPNAITQASGDDNISLNPPRLRCRIITCAGLPAAGMSTGCLDSAPPISQPGCGR